MKPRPWSVMYAVSGGSSTTPARWATAEWQLAVATGGSMIAGAMNAHAAGRGPCAPPHPTTDAAAAETNRNPRLRCSQLLDLGADIRAGLCTNETRSQQHLTVILTQI